MRRLARFRARAAACALLASLLALPASLALPRAASAEGDAADDGAATSGGLDEDLAELGDEDVEALDHEHLSSLRQYGWSPLAIDRFPDLVLARPLGLGLAVLGTLTYGIAAPVNAITHPGTNRELTDALLIGPYRWVFTRPIGAAVDSLEPDDEQ